MKRSIAMLIGVVVACAALSSHAADPNTKTEPKPPYERLLQGDDAKKAADLAKTIEQQESADNYAEAIKAADELLALRSRVQGADHWEAVNQKWDIELLKKEAVLSKEERAAWRQAESDDLKAQQLEVKHRFQEALPRRQELLERSRRILGEEHPYTAVSYNWLAFKASTYPKLKSSLQKKFPGFLWI